MKLKAGIITLMLMVSSFAWATPLNIDCWDGSFAYRMLHVEEQGDNYKISMSGLASELGHGLGLIAQSNGWFLLNLDFLVPKQNCIVSNKDRRLIACSAPSNVLVNLAYNDDEGAHHSEILKALYVSLEIVDSVETNAGGAVSHALISRLGINKTVASGEVIGASDTRTFPEGSSQSAGCHLK